MVFTGGVRTNGDGVCCACYSGLHAGAFLWSMLPVLWKRVHGTGFRAGSPRRTPRHAGGGLEAGWLQTLWLVGKLLLPLLAEAGERCSLQAEEQTNPQPAWVIQSNSWKPCGRSTPREVAPVVTTCGSCQQSFQMKRMICFFIFNKNIFGCAESLCRGDGLLGGVLRLLVVVSSPVERQL